MSVPLEYLNEEARSLWLMTQLCGDCFPKMTTPASKWSVVLSTFDNHDRLETHSNKSKFRQQLKSGSGMPSGEFIFYIKESQGGFWLNCSEWMIGAETLMTGTLEYDFQWNSPRLQTKLDEIVDSLDSKYYRSNEDENSIASIALRQSTGKQVRGMRARMAPPPQKEDIHRMIDTGIALVDTIDKHERAFEEEIGEITARDVNSILRK